MRKTKVLPRVIILDVGTIFIDGECSFCGTKKHVVAAWRSRDALYKCKACTLCIKRYSHPKDWKLWSQLWYTMKRVQQRNIMLSKLDTLCQRYPTKRFYPILRELICVRSPHESITEAIQRMWLGKQPTRAQYTYITSQIRTFRNARKGILPNRKTYDKNRGTGSRDFYTSTGSCGFF